MGILCLPIALIADAFVYRVFGNTLGKALLGLKVGTLDAKALNFGQYLGRNFSMWVSGLALGFPLIYLFTMAHQSGRLGKGRQASYDESTGYRVRAKPIGWARTVAFGVAFAGVFSVMVVLNGMEKKAERNALLSSVSQDYSWENPITRLNAKIDSQWKNATQQNADGETVYIFSERTDHAEVILGTEHASGYTLDDYARAFKKSTSANMHFSDGGRFFERSGRQIWEDAGSMANSTSIRLKVRIIRFGSVFWRVVTIQAMPYGYSDSLVEQLHAALWSTIR